MSVSRTPTELSPVRPVIEFDMVDPRYIHESDVLSALDERPNLMELTPSEFESLITNLFEKTIHFLHRAEHQQAGTENPFLERLPVHQQSSLVANHALDHRRLGF